MRFKIRRISTIGSDAAPCDEAVKSAEGDWEIEVADLAALMALHDKVGDLILGHTGVMMGGRVVHEGDYQITIYDDYNE
jgi:hypothetical protein